MKPPQKKNRNQKTKIKQQRSFECHGRRNNSRAINTGEPLYGQKAKATLINIRRASSYTGSPFFGKIPSCH